MKSMWRVMGLLAISLNAWAADSNKLCLAEVCIGDDLLKLEAKWVPVAIDGAATQYYANELTRKPARELYKAANQKLIADGKVLNTLLPYVIDAQAFDDKALEELKKVEAFCTSLTLKGELLTGTKERVLVTAQSIPPTAEGMHLRVVRVEMIFDAYHPISRPEQAANVKALTKSLKKQFKGLVEVRDIDDMFLNDKYTDKPAILGFKFSSDVAVPMAIKLRDVSDLPVLDESSAAAVCKI
ncbi:MAG: hypothetical protein HYV16_09880 [Gammaproteobacteria bacterium]|nr:hypothetical protein [Gammaproteobacteria bacterium]